MCGCGRERCRRSEISNLYSGPDAFANGTSTQGIWLFNGGYTDTSGNNNTLTAQGSPVFSTTVPYSSAATSTQAYGWFSHIANELVQDWDGGATHRDRATEFTYSTSTGNLTQQVERGEVSGNSDGTYSGYRLRCAVHVVHLLDDDRDQYVAAEQQGREEQCEHHRRGGEVLLRQRLVRFDDEGEPHERRKLDRGIDVREHDEGLQLVRPHREQHRSARRDDDLCVRDEQPLCRDDDECARTHNRRALRLRERCREANDRCARLGAHALRSIRWAG